uniref:Uncharacterized protein n=1 Tax=Psilocybe cubensis TaxID=181762 RepID=A0A8H8CQ57_PSICU
MAPNFLQKFVKSSTTSTNSSNNTPRERVSSDVYSSLRSPSETGSSSSQAHSSGSGSGTTSPGGRARAATIQTASGSSSSLTSPTTPTQASVILKGVQQQQQQAQSGRRSPSRRSSTNNSSDRERETSRIPSIITTLSGRSRSKGSKDKEKEKKKKSDKEKNANANRDSLTVQNHHTPLSAGDRTSWGSAYSSQPNFTIVPPSPLVRNGDLYSSDSDAYDNENDNDAATTHSNTNTNFNGASPNTAEDQDSAATPTLPSFSGSASQSGASKNIHATPSNSTSSTSSTPNTSSSFTNNSSHTSSSNTNTSNTSDHDASDHDMSNLAPGAYQVRKKPSNRSIKNGAAPPEINVAAAAATLGGAPQAVNGSTANGSGEGAGGEEPVNGAVTQRPIVESPTDLKFPAPASSGSGMTASTSTSTTASSANSNLGAPSSSTTLQRENTTSSLFSPDATTKSKRPWKRSTTRKPTGLASAIAASGLAMANPSLSAAQSAQMPVVPVPPPALSAGSSKDKDSNDPYLSRSPAQSAVSTGKGRHTKSRSGETSPRSSKSRKSSMGSPPRSGTGRSRRASSAKSTDEFGALHPSSSNRANGGNDDTGSNISRRPSFYKSLISHSSSGSSDSDSDSGSVDSSDLDIGEEDIPVTGFAVASNKRNADFHELFPGVPEGDYLIEGT